MEKIAENWSELTPERKEELFASNEGFEATLDELKALDGPFKIVIKEL